MAGRFAPKILDFRSYRHAADNEQEVRTPEQAHVQRPPGIIHLQRYVGNSGVKRMLAKDHQDTAALSQPDAATGDTIQRRYRGDYQTEYPGYGGGGGSNDPYGDYGSQREYPGYNSGPYGVVGGGYGGGSQNEYPGYGDPNSGWGQGGGYGNGYETEYPGYGDPYGGGYGGGYGGLEGIAGVAGDVLGQLGGALGGVFGEGGLLGGGGSDSTYEDYGTYGNGDARGYDENGYEQDPYAGSDYGGGGGGYGGGDYDYEDYGSYGNGDARGYDENGYEQDPYASDYGGGGYGDWEESGGNVW